jgi:hypothetical protein
MRVGLRAAALCAVCLFARAVAGAQDSAVTPGGGEAEAAVAGQSAPVDPATALALDIRTSSLLELASWCRELGLPEDGTKDELARRLRTHFGLPEPAGGAAAPKPGDARTVVVESAQGTEYFTVEVVNEEYARLRGGVVVSFSDDEATHRVKAREILYNRTRNTINAAGAVEYEKTSGDSREYFRGESLNLDLTTWTGAFLDGSSEKSKADEETAYRFSADVIARAPEGVTVLSDATVTTASSASPYWSLAAGRIWLLPGSEWAVSNAVLRVGEIPLLYIPFFYFPGDELVFHPVIGYRTREGSYVQTTTYLLGRPKAETSSEQSIMTILQGDEDEERRQEGIFLRRTGKRAPPEDGARLSLLMDAYANLGYYLGATAAAPKGKTVTKADASLGLAFSRDIYPLDSGGLYYSPFSGDHPYGDWNTGPFFSGELPFRYRFVSEGALTLSRGSFSWKVPLYSDPFIDQDFLDRSENMDWFNLAKQGASTSDESDVDVLGSVELSLSGSFTPDVRRFSPYLESFSLSPIKSTLDMSVRSDSQAESYSIGRSFFYPTKATLLSVSANAKGSLFSAGAAAAAKAKTSPAASGKTAAPEAESVFASFGEPRSPWAAGAGEESESKGSGSDGLPVPPVLSAVFATGRGDSEASFDLGYTLTPTFSTDAVFNTSGWESAEDVRWDDLASMLVSVKNSGKLSANAALPGNVLSASAALGASAAWQSNAYLNETAPAYDTQAERDAAAVRNYASTYLKTNAEFSLTYRPFIRDAVWSQSNLNYILKGNVLATDFDGTAGNPHWSFDFGSWRREYVTTHQASVNLAALVRDLAQNLTVSTDIAPRPSEIAASSTIRVWKSTTTASASVSELEDGGVYDTVTLTETIDLGKSRSFAQSLAYEPEDDEFTSVATSFSYGSLTGAFSAKRSVGYGLDPDKGWIVDDAEEKLRPQSLSLSYRQTKDLPPLWKNRIGLNYGVDSSFAFDFQRYTQSSFTFVLSTTFKISEFLDLTFASSSKNSVVYRYFQDMPAFGLPLRLPGETNPLADLLDSFAFSDVEKRKASGFKLKSLSVKATHYLGDWTAQLGYETTPYLDSVTRTYKFTSEISFLVKWTPVPEFRAETLFDEDGFALK